MSQGEGYEVQLGSGTEFINADQRSQKFGCVNQLAILKVDDAVIFYDNLRKSLSEISASGGKAKITSILDLRPYIKQQTAYMGSNLSAYRGYNPILVYDSAVDLVLFVIMNHSFPNNNETIHYNRKRKRIVGFDDRYFTVGFSTDEKFFTIPGEPYRSEDTNDKVYCEHSYAIPTFYGNAMETEIHLILNKDPRYDKIYDSYELLFENYPPKEMDVITKDGEKTIKWSNTSLHEKARNSAIDVRNSVWGTFPTFYRKRTRGKYIELKIRSTTTYISNYPSLSGIIIKSRKAL